MAIQISDEVFNMIMDLKDRRFPGYVNYRIEWDFFTQSYDGGMFYMKNNLFRFSRESNEEFTARLKRAYKNNHSERVVNIYNSYLFKSPAERSIIKDSSKKLEVFQENTDGQGNSINDFMKQVDKMGEITGRCYIVMDRAPRDAVESPMSQRENLSDNMIPYCYTIKPQDVIDISFDDYGNIKWLIVKETYRNDDDWKTAENKTRERYRVWTPENIFLVDGNNTETLPGPGFVPVIYYDPERQDQYTGASLLKTVSYIDRAIFNNQSRLDVILNEQAFSQLALPFQALPQSTFMNETDVDEDGNENSVAKEVLELSAKRVFLFDAASSKGPEWISPDPEQARIIMEAIAADYKSLYSTLGLAGEVGEDVKMESGIAKAWNFDKVNRMLSSRADNLEETELKLYNMFSKYLEMEVEVKVDYPETFDLETDQETIDRAERLLLLDMPLSYQKEVMKDLLGKTLPKANPEVIKIITNDIEAYEGPDLKTPTFDFDE